MSKASLKTTNEWNTINWAKVQRKVFKLQKRIFQAVKSGQKAKARNLQKLLVKSFSAKLLAVRRVTQDNQGRKTAGIDGVKIVLSYQRDNLTKELNLDGYKSKALRRVWIPKPGRDEKRPLGIPTIKDRAMQALVKSALEPYWEAQFEGTSYGFRPGKSAHDAIKAHHEAIKAIIKRDKTAPQATLIKNLNPVIRGWCNYFRTVASKETFSSEDNQLWQLLRAWTVSRTGKANYEKLRKYFSQGKYGTWTFQTRQENGYVLTKHTDTEVKRHTLVQPEASPYDGNWTYWSKRRGEYPDTPSRVAKLLKKQKGYCNHCHQSFTPDDIVEVDHIIPKSKGGKDEYKNLQLLHRHCHDNKTRYDGSLERNLKPVVPLPEDYRWENDILVIVPMTRVN